MAVSIHYFRSDPPNFGDELNTQLWRTLIPELDETTVDAVLVGIGTILDHRVPQDRDVFVLGAGAGLAPLPRGLRSGRFHVLAVRGPLTAALAGLPEELAVTDAALLLREIHPQLVGLHRRCPDAGVVFVPHVFTSQDAGWRRACARAGVELVDPTEGCETILQKIASARLVIAEAMHGAIVADAFRVPWIPVASTRHFSTFKWVDWALSLQVPFRPTLLPAVSVRHWCQRVWLSAFAERCRSDEVSIGGGESVRGSPVIEQLLNETAQRVSARPSAAVTWLRLKASAFHKRALDPFVTRVSRAHLRALDERMETRVAAMLWHLSSRDGYLSREEVSLARLRSLQEKVRWLRDRLSSRASHTLRRHG